MSLGQETRVHILHLEDDPLDKEWVETALLHSGINLEVEHVDSQENFLKALITHRPDLIISDFSLPGYTGLHALQLVRSRGLEAPFIFFSGTMGEDAAISSLKGGATDYVLKQHPERLIPAVRRALQESEERVARLLAEEKIREQAALLDEARDAICVNDLDQRVIYWNRSAERLYGWKGEEVIGKKADEFLFQKDIALSAVKTLISKGEWQGEMNQSTHSGNTIYVQSRWSLIRDTEGLPKSILIINTDTTERKQMEARLKRTQRMENLGALASGIAHDLNNILTPIMVAAEIVGEDLDHSIRAELVDTIKTSAKRGSEMVKQILSFTRGVSEEMVPVDVRHVVKEVIRLIRETIPRFITLTYDYEPELPHVFGNITQLHQVLLNLCVNARDAMPEGGMLSLKAYQTELPVSELPPDVLSNSRNFIVLEVSDTGMGIPPELKEKIFEPFFTTKEPGKGTGIGLSTVMDIVRSHGGFLKVNSEEGKGTTFCIYLPVAPGTASESGANTAQFVKQGNAELVLVVEDENAIREITCTTLQAFNYRAITASNCNEALQIYADSHEEIDLVMTDMLMPGMTGRQFLDALIELNPAVKIVCTSGQDDQRPIAESRPENVKAFLSKPFTISKLLATLHDSLHG